MLQQHKPALPFHEHFAAWMLICFIVFLTIMNLCFYDGQLPKNMAPPYNPTSALIEVNIEGAVKYPGLYQVKKGTFVSEVLELAQPLEEANLKRIKLDSKITRRRTIRIR